MDWVIDLLINAGLLAGIGGLIYYFLKTKLEAKVKAEYDERAIKFQHVYPQKIVILQHVIERIWALEQAVGKYVAIWDEALKENIDDLPREEITSGVINFRKSFERFEESFEPYRIYFNEELADKIAKLRDRYADTVSVCHLLAKKMNGSTSKEAIKKWVDANQFINKESPKIRREIEKEIRKEFQV